MHSDVYLIIKMNIQPIISNSLALFSETFWQLTPTSWQPMCCMKFQTCYCFFFFVFFTTVAGLLIYVLKIL